MLVLHLFIRCWTWCCVAHHFQCSEKHCKNAAVHWKNKSSSEESPQQLCVSIDVRDNAKVKYWSGGYF